MQYLGGKQRIAKELSAFLNSQLTDNQPFVDLFCGSCNILTRIDKSRTVIGNDANECLIAMWQQLQEGWLPPKHITKEVYYEIKNKVAQSKDDLALKAFVGFGCSFAGKWWGGFAKSNHGQDYCLCAFNSTMKKAKNLDTVVFSALDYRNVPIPHGALVYCDIPYKGTTQYSAVGAFDHEAFYSWMKLQRDCTILVSEYAQNVPDFCEVVWSKNSKQDIRNASGCKSETIEVVFKMKEKI